MLECLPNMYKAWCSVPGILKKKKKILVLICLKPWKAEKEEEKEGEQEEEEVEVRCREEDDNLSIHRNMLVKLWHAKHKDKSYPHCKLSSYSAACLKRKNPG